ncbi:hypothetical protein Poly51_18740 [Rubripirellula tenax]|uniref:GHMP kinase C-terminal domain-containing protein n=1 Tax=Rubripirellula tenax TaxID=2528015 RepID=A0A5C6FCA8_9BACT|nr:beta-ribofuranosylaminobenzene 5'-phosphate synthase [Rubripirellula tenax]TWU59088.1 hypothetical protein Poly51_18740 [Rubripirellula tenax]
MNDWQMDSSPTEKTPGRAGNRDDNDIETVRITTGARLHFGLLDTAAPFGGVGVMVDQPSTQITVRPHSHFEALGRIAQRANEIARGWSDRIGRDTLPSCRVEATQTAAAHCGLGSGTQLAMAIAEGIARFEGIEMPLEELAVDVAGRGKRSAVGVHGYIRGGLISENADSPTSLNPICDRIELPEAWRVLVVRPAVSAQPISGEAEIKQFAALGSAVASAKSHLKDVLANQIVPAAEAGDLDGFTDAIHRYNLASGMLFANVQGGPYHGDDVARLIAQLIEAGGRGVGQSSWGPGVFTWFDSAESMDRFAERLPPHAHVIAKSQPLNRGRSLG